MLCQYLQNVIKAPNTDFPRVQPINEILREGKLCKEENYTNVVEACQFADGRVYTALCVSGTQSQDTRVGSRQRVRI